MEHSGEHLQGHLHTADQGSAGKHEGHSLQMFRDRFWVSFILTIPILLSSDLANRVLGWQLPTFPYSAWLVLALSTVVFLYGGGVFLQGAYRELRAGLPGMMTLIALAISVSYFYSVAALSFSLGEPLFWELTTLITIMLLGHWVEMRAVSSASGALQELAKLLPDTAEKIIDGNPQTVPVNALAIGDVVLVRPGAKIPADGEIVEGETSVNESMITGESFPVDKKLGSQVIAGTVNGTGSVRVKVTKIGEGTALAGIMRLVAQAQASRSNIQDLADRAAYYLTVVAISVGAVTVLAWFLAGASPAVVLERAVAVLVVTCPHALGLAIPLVVSISTTLSARSGLLVREKLALELARKIDVVLFDKTGTLTSGELGVTEIAPATGWDEKTVLQWAASLEAYSEHTIAKGIVKAAAERKISLLKAQDVQALPGRGIKGRIGGKLVYVGGPQLLEKLKARIPSDLEGKVQRLSQEGKTVIYLLIGKKVMAALGVADLIRPESRQAVSALQKMGAKVVMVTGDAKPVAEWVARELGIDEYYAEVLPESKVEIVRKLQERDGVATSKSGRQRVVMMVGDGVNDAPALRTADVGVAIGAGTDVAIESAGIVLMRSDPRDIAKVIRLARVSYRKMVENLLWATGYNLFAIPAAAFGFLSPALSAVLMSTSTVIVAVNAQLLRSVRL